MALIRWGGLSLFNITLPRYSKAPYVVCPSVCNVEVPRSCRLGYFELFDSNYKDNEPRTIESAFWSSPMISNLVQGEHPQILFMNMAVIYHWRPSPENLGARSKTGGLCPWYNLEPPLWSTLRWYVALIICNFYVDIPWIAARGYV